MFCKHCGSEYFTDEAVLCVKCGAPKGKGENFCHKCGKPVPAGSEVCMNCGVSSKNISNKPKSKLVAGLLGLFLGHLGIHNFYLGYNQRAVIQLSVSVGGWLFSCCYGLGLPVVLGIQVWAIVEAVMILTGKIDKDAQGIELTD